VRGGVQPSLAPCDEICREGWVGCGGVPVCALLRELTNETAGWVVVHVDLILLLLGLDVGGDVGEVGHSSDLLGDALTVLTLHAQVDGRVSIGHGGELGPVQFSGVEARKHGCQSAQHSAWSATRVLCLSLKIFFNVSTRFFNF
jgi:hypothetical protein